MVDEAGLRFSGGERHRLALARADSFAKIHRLCY